MSYSIFKALYSDTKFTDDDSGDQLFESLKIEDIRVYEMAMTARNPIEASGVASESVYSGGLEYDIKSTKVLEPARVEVMAISPDLTTMEALISAWKSSTQSMSLVCRDIAIYYLTLTGIEIVQGTDMMTANPVRLTFEKFQPDSAVYFDPDNQVDASNYGVTVNLTTSTLSSDVSSLVSKIESLLS